VQERKDMAADNDDTDDDDDRSGAERRIHQRFDT
jgi:hypothetical protein